MTRDDYDKIKQRGGKLTPGARRVLALMRDGWTLHEQRRSWELYHDDHPRKMHRTTNSVVDQIWTADLVVGDTWRLKDTVRTSTPEDFRAILNACHVREID